MLMNRKRRRESLQTQNHHLLQLLLAINDKDKSYSTQLNAHIYLFLKGHYRFQRHETDPDSMANVPLMEGYWTLKLVGYKREDKIMCGKKVRFHSQDEAPRVRMADKHTKERELKPCSRVDAFQYSL